MNEFQHRRLDSSTSEIRLVWIEKKADNDPTEPVRLTLRHAFLDGNEQFNALSYAWGDDPPSNEVVIHDATSTGRLLVRKNLYDFLRIAEKSDEEWSSKWIFIDQICIDQENLKERDHQVGQMGRLYSTALATIIWPQSVPESGRRDENKEWERPMFDDQDLGKACEREKLRRDNPVRLDAVMAYLRTQSVGSIWDCLASSYWWRAWVLQEIILAPMVHILMPGGLWTIEDLTWLTLFLEDQVPLLVARRATTSKAFDISIKLSLASAATGLGSHLRKLCFQRHSRSEKPNNEEASDLKDVKRITIPFYKWEVVIQLARDSSSTYPQDRIYGMMGLVREDMQFDVDYTLTPWDLLMRILHFYHREGTLTKVSTVIVRAWYLIFETSLNKSGIQYEHLHSNAFHEKIMRAVEDFAVASSKVALES